MKWLQYWIVSLILLIRVHVLKYMTDTSLSVTVYELFIYCNMCFVRVNILYTAVHTYAARGNRLQIMLPGPFVYMHIQTPVCDIYVYKKSTYSD